MADRNCACRLEALPNAPGMFVVRCWRHGGDPVDEEAAPVENWQELDGSQEFRSEDGRRLFSWLRGRN